MDGIGKMHTADSSRLEQLFGSKTRVRLLLVFLKNANSSYYVRELTRLLNVQINSVRRELDNLKDIGIINVVQEGDKNIEKYTGIKEKKYYRLNQNFILIEELQNLFVKSEDLEEKDFIQKLAEVEGVEYLVLTGFFTQAGNDEFKVDLLAVGSIDKEVFKGVIQKFEKHLNKEINFSLLDKKEYLHRKKVSDKFLYDILSSKKIVVVDKLGE